MDEILEKFIDPKFGIVSNVSTIPPLHRHPRLWLAFAKPASALTLGAGADTRLGAGIGIDRELASNAAVGESIERYCSLFEPEDLIAGTWNELSLNYPLHNIAELNMLCSRNATDFKMIEPNINVRWCSARRTATDKLTYIPWSLVSLGATAGTRTDLDVGYPGPSISTGLACASSWNEAVLKALLECCERDAVMVAWYTRAFQSRISPEYMAKEWPFLASEMERCGIESYLMDVSNDLKVPTFLSAISPVESRNRMALGMASATTAYRAALRALMESLHTWMWADSSSMRGEYIPYLWGNPLFGDFESRVVAYGSGMMAAETERFLARCATVEHTPLDSFEKPRWESARTLAVQLEASGHPVLVRDVTTDDVASQGLFVARCITPTFQSMDGVHAYRIVNKDRFLISDSTIFDAVPHPFP